MKNISEIKSKICDLRCELEELASEIHELWISTDEPTKSYYILNMEDAIQDTADKLAEWED